MTNEVPKDGFIDIEFPLNHIRVPETLQGARMKIYEGSWVDVTFSLMQNGV